MIKLTIASYCNDCSNFEPEVINKNVIYDDYEACCRTSGTMFVVCKHGSSCRRFMTYLKSQLEKEKGETNDKD